MRSEQIVFLWDIDGTLIDAGGAGSGALFMALQREFQVEDFKPLRLHGRTDRGIVGELLESHGLEPSDSIRHRLCTAYFQLLPEELQRRGGRVLPGVTRVLDSLIELPHSVLGVMTGNMSASAQAKLEHFRLSEYFRFGVYGDDADVRPDLMEPARKAVVDHCGETHPPEQVVVIGDTVLDVELAQLMGARSLAVCTGGCSVEELRDAGADHVVEDLQQTDVLLEWFFSSSK